MKHALSAALAALLLIQSANAADEVQDNGLARSHIARAEKIAGTDLRQPLFLCYSGGLNVVRTTLETHSDKWIEPTRAFDNLFFVGNGFVGIWVVKTSEGLILFDATQSEVDARDHLVPGLIKLGLDPKDACSRRRPASIHERNTGRRRNHQARPASHRRIVRGDGVRMV